VPRKLGIWVSKGAGEGEEVKAKGNHIMAARRMARGSSAQLAAAGRLGALLLVRDGQD
jgi:hypothetical protein